MTPSGAMEVGSGSARLFLYSSNDPSVEIGGVDYKIYTENFPPPAAASSGGLKKITRMGSSGTFTPQAGTKYFVIEAVGGGGGGATIVGGVATGQNIIGSGGGAGAYIRLIYAPTDATPNLNVTIGSGGPASASGGSTTVATVDTGSGSTTLVSAPGGAGGTAYAVAAGTNFSRQTGGVGGLARVATLTALTALNALSGAVGEDGLLINGVPQGGAGGSSPFGRGGIPGAANANGGTYDGPGAGGAGAARTSDNSSGWAGGTGGGGLVIIWEYA